MDKRFFLRMIVPTVVLAVAVISLLMVIPATAPYFAWFSWAWAGCIVAGALGVKYLLAGIFTRNNVAVKKVLIIFGALFLVIAVFCLTWAIALPHEIIAPTIALILTAALFLGVLFTGGKSWDTGDNQKAGYQNYHQRKAAAEKAAKAAKDAEEA